MLIMHFRYYDASAYYVGIYMYGYTIIYVSHVPILTEYQYDAISSKYTDILTIGMVDDHV